jgi:UDP-N-acetylmuramoyl-tripeptide--D-alanyl-D-alanine ligase
LIGLRRKSTILGAGGTQLREIGQAARDGGPGEPQARKFLRKVKRRLPPPLMALGSRIMRSLALAYRVPLLGGVTFVGVTGSTGKTTTKDLIHAILSSRLPGWKSEGNDNIVVYRTIFGTSPWHAYCVQEIAAAIGGKRIALERPLSLVRPRIGVVTNIGTDHLSAFGSVEEIAAEKGKLVAVLPEAGTAILNADDPNVLAMGSRCRGRIVTYGLALGATIRAENVSCHWPDRLSFDVLYDGQREMVRTQLCGTHWVHASLPQSGWHWRWIFH